VREPWDREKAEANLRKHGVGFAEATTVDEDEHAWRREDDSHSAGEQRHVVVGLSERGRVLFVACTYRRGKMRPISARRATKRERHEYWLRY
jgi:uncharacterized DUF497 family protein